MERRLNIRQVGTSNVYEITNMGEELIGFIERIRNGQWMHYSLHIPHQLVVDLANEGNGLTFSPGCLDEIREFCRKLNGRRKDKEKCENCGEMKVDVKYTKKYGNGEFLCPECRGEY